MPATAARARCSSTARRCAPAWSPPRRRMAARSSPSRAWLHLPMGRALQSAFHRHDAAQCGICTPGMLMAAADLLVAPRVPGTADGHGRAGRRAVPLHGLPENRRCRSGVAQHQFGWRDRAGRRLAMPRSGTCGGHRVLAHRRPSQDHGRGPLRRRRRPRRRALAEGGPLAPRARAIYHRRPRAVPASQPRHRAHLHGPRRARRKLVRHLSRPQGPAGVRGRPRPPSRRAGVGAGGVARRGRVGRRRRPSDRLGAAARPARHRRRRSADGAPAIHADKPDNILTSGMRRMRRPAQRGTRAAHTAEGTFETVLRRACLHRARSRLCRAASATAWKSMPAPRHR